jgi:type I restriction enzyme M protein
LTQQKAKILTNGLKSAKIFEQTFKNIDDILHKDAGCGSELDYVAQTS